MSEKVSELVMKVRQILQDGTKDTGECLRQIDNEIDEQKAHIDGLFSKNLDSVIAHYIKYHQTIVTQRHLEQQCEQFRRHIEKATKLNQYDQGFIDRVQSNLMNLSKLKKSLQQCQDYTRVAKKAAMSIRQQKFNNAIKSINQLKMCQLGIDTPLKKILPILKSKILEHLYKLMDVFWSSNQSKMEDMGKKCYTRIQSNQQEKINIYQTFFGRAARSGVVSSVNMRATAMGSEEDLRFLRKESEQNTVILNKFMLRTNVEMNSLKKVKAMVIELQQASKFNEMLKSNILRQLALIQEQKPCTTSEEYTRLLWFFIGFLLIRREVVAYFDIRAQEQLFTRQIYELLTRKALQVVSSGELGLALQVKTCLDLFYKILELIKVCNQPQKYKGVLRAVTEEYTRRNIEQFDRESAEAIPQDTFSKVKSQNHQELVLEVLGVPAQEEYPFTQVVQFALRYFHSTFQHLAHLLAQSDLQKRIAYSHLTQLYTRFITLYGGEMKAKQNVFEVIQGQVNLQWITKLYHHYIAEIQNNRMKMEENETMEALKVQLTSKITEFIRIKIEQLLINYEISKMNKAKEQRNDFVEWMMEYVRQMIQFMESTGLTTTEGVIIEIMRELCSQYWDLLQNTEEYSLVSIYNLDQDLAFIYRYCADHFNKYGNLVQRFQSLKEFYSLMLLNNIIDLADPQKKSLCYPTLDIPMLIPVLKKYVQCKNQPHCIRELKKKDVELLISKLKGGK